MNCRTVREMLAMIRPDSQDAELADIAPALLHIEQCAECQTCFEAQQRADRELSLAMRKVSVPVDLKSRLLAQIAANAAPTSVPSTLAEPQVPASTTRPRSANRDWNRRQATTVVSAALLLLSFVGAWWFVYAQPPRSLLVEQLVDLSHQPLLTNSSAFQQSFHLQLPSAEIHLPTPSEAIKQAYSLQYRHREIGAAIRYQLQRSRRNPLSVMLVVFDLQKVDIPNLKDIGSSFLQADVTYPKPNGYATRVWRIGQNLYVCYVISKNPEDLDALRNQPTAA